jgi:PTS system nitrogen regulatory IIA component
LLEWAISRNQALPADLTNRGFRKAAPSSFVEALRHGGIIHRVGGTDKASVLRAVIDSMRLPANVDREFLFQVLLAREAVGSTALGDGIAIPHLRNPIVLHVERAMVCLCFLANPIEFGAPDGKPVHTLFMLVSPTVRDHTHQLARLAFFLRNPGFRAAIERRAHAEEILHEACLVEPQIDNRDDHVG